LNGGSQTFYPNRDFAIRQAYVALRTPLGNGLDWKVGVFDSIIGYESVAGPSNPNYTRSYGHSIEPQTITGILASYRFNDHISLSAGVGDTVGPTINGRAFSNNFDTDNTKAESDKTYMAALALTAPDNWGFLSGSSIYGGFVTGYNNVDNTPGGIGVTDFEQNSTSYYAGATFATPISALKLGVAFDDLEVHDTSGESWVIGGYASYQATEKLSLHMRGEYVRDTKGQQLFNSTRIFEWTTTIQYDLWKNVLSRVEFRWDHSADGTPAFGGEGSGAPNRDNAYMLAANIIYKF
jgi:hypothetical protein